MDFATLGVLLDSEFNNRAYLPPPTPLVTCAQERRRGRRGGGARQCQVDGCGGPPVSEVAVSGVGGGSIGAPDLLAERGWRASVPLGHDP